MAQEKKPRKERGRLSAEGYRVGPNVSGAFFLQLRQALGKKQQEVEKETGYLYQQTLSRYERVKGDIPQDIPLGLALAFSRYYGVSIERIAEAFGFITPYKGDRIKQDPRGQAFIDWLNSIDPSDYDRVFAQLDVAKAAFLMSEHS